MEAPKQVTTHHFDILKTENSLEKFHRGGKITKLIKLIKLTSYQANRKGVAYI